ncbi:MAG: hypothetical protein Q4G22_14015 [Paracoccus sp. (in: a-proteobacteria)]|nr:hypothetical protein [Paracoccus sp. (in: a-proteobacteria)]MDO5632932.1 hypothetical protein [Paracoccus sp. (in: a-proteobacteria)]
MSTKIAAFLVCIFAAVLLADRIWLDGTLPVYLVRQMAALVDWITFWN